jgi:hypothetical protein
MPPPPRRVGRRERPDQFVSAGDLSDHLDVVFELE